MSNKYNKPTAKSMTRSQINWRALGVVILTVVTLLVVFPGTVNSGINWMNSKTNIGLPNLPTGGFNLGLDGGRNSTHRFITNLRYDWR